MDENGPKNAGDEVKDAVEAAKKAKKTADDTVRTAKNAGKIAGKIASAVTFIITNFLTILQGIALVLVALLAINVFQYVIEVLTAQNTPDQIYEALDIADIKELIQIEGNKAEGYHLEYVDDIDEKIEKLIEVLGNKSGVYTFNKNDSDLIKEMIKAEAITQFPNLAGEYNADNEEFQGAVTVRRITPNKEISEMKNTGTGEVTTLGDSEQEEIIRNENMPDKSDREANALGTKTLGDASKIYVLAIAAGHNNSDNTGAEAESELGKFVEQDMTIKVAEKVEEICSEYTNLIVVQTGSTSENPAGIKVDERVQLAKDANPDLCIQIHFNESDNDEGSGVETWYEYGDGYSEKLAQILSDKMSEKMGLKNRGAKTKENNSDYWEIIDSYYQTNFPSVITEGGFLDNPTDQEVIKNGGIDKYAKAIVEGCIQYLITDHSEEEVIFSQGITESSGIESRVYDLKYIEYEDFEDLVNSNNKKALNYFTLDESFNVVTASWKVDNGSTEIVTNSPYNMRATLQNVTMPYEYLLYFLIDSGNKEFIREFADLVADTEIVMAVQDNITTTKITAEVQQRIKASVDEKTTAWKKHNERSNEESSFSEFVRTSISITYADTWFVRYSREGNSYSANSLGVEKGELVNRDKDNPISVRGKVTENTSTEEKGYGSEGGYDISEVKKNTIMELIGTEIGEDGEPKPIYETKEYTYVIKERYKKTIHTISNVYEEGEPVVEDHINKFVNLYNKHKMANCVKEQWLFQILEGNTKTVNMVDLTKYLMYVATGTSYGVEDYDFSIYDLSKFSNMGSSMGGFSTFIEYLHAWESHEGITPDGTKYIVGDDGAGHPTVGYGIDIYKSGFLDRFLAAGYDVSIGAEIDVEFVDALEEEEIQAAIQTVEQKTAGLNLTQYQKYALVSRIYNCGSSGAFTSRNGKTFVEAYTSYWNPETDDEYGVTANNGMYEHPLYANYMYLPNTSDGEYMPGLENRRKSEWILFKTGYYDRIDKWCSNVDGGIIVEKAVECHAYLRNNGFTYAQDGTNIPLSGSDRTIDCSSYVSWALYEAGFVEEFQGYQKTSSVFTSNLWGWQEVSVSEAQPGDIVTYSGHVEIIAADEGDRFRVYNCGGNSSIMSAGTTELPESSRSGYTKSQIIKILRAPQN